MSLDKHSLLPDNPYHLFVTNLMVFQSGGGGRSRYDTIADIHGLAMIQAHSGPNFLPWHRLYLLM